MNKAAQGVQRTYLTLLLFHTLAASFIWGINTLFLLDAGLSNFEAFAANAFFTAGWVLFEIPTGVIADLRGRRMSYLLGTLTLAATTLLYLYMWQTSAPFWAWAVVSALLGLGFTFFSGAVEAWLVDALSHHGFKGHLETVLARGEIVQGGAMLVGSVAGGVIAQLTNLGVPYIFRVGMLLLTFILAFVLMKDIGFKPLKGVRPSKQIRLILRSAVQHGLKKPSVRWLMVIGIFSSGVSIYAFYAMQPYLLQLYGDPNAYSVAGLAAALVAGAQIAGGLLVPRVEKHFKRRTTILSLGVASSVVLLLLLGVMVNFWIALALFALWALLFALIIPVRQAFLNDQIQSKERATVLSFDALLGSSGGVFIQPALGKAADVWSYPLSYILSAGFQALALPFLLIERNQKTPADKI